MLLPIYTSKVAAGFPSPADDYLETPLDLNQIAVKNPASTFLLRVSGDSMIGAGIFSGDILVVDRSIPATHGQVVIAAIDGELTVKRLLLNRKFIVLSPENPAYPERGIHEESFVIWGVATHVLHAL